MNTETPNNPEDKKTTETGGAAPTAQQPAATPSDAAAAFAGGTATATPPKTNEPDPTQAHRDAVEAGRLKKMSDELRAEREKNAELQRKLAEAEKLSRTQKLKDLAGYQAMDEAGRELVDKLVEMRSGGGDDGAERYKAELDEIRRNQAAMAAAAAQGNAARAQADAFKALEQSYPGLLHRIGEGDLKDLWTSFRGRTDDYAGRTYDEIVAGANARGNGAALVRVVQEFVRTNGLERQYQKLAGTPRPAGTPATPSGTDANGKHVYQSLDEIYLKMDEARSKERRGLIDRETRRKLIAELEAAEDEGRYLKQ